MKAKLHFSCPAKWEEMRIGLVSRHCLSCSKDVADLTRMSHQAFREFFQENKGTEICGRVRRDQVTWHRHEPEFIVRRPAVPIKRGRTGVQLLALMGLALTACGEVPTKGKDSLQDDPIAKDEDDSSTGCETASDRAIVDEEDFPMLLGLLVPDDEEGIEGSFHQAMPQTIPEVQPEFPGGVDSLYAFLSKSIVYPDWDLKNNISGKVWAEFTVEADGSLQDARIVKSVPGQKGLDGIVLSAIARMPKWRPAELNGSTVPSKMRLPVVFDLAN
ncbi:MAG: energy transducer TonB [Flavobacteriales bacterium]